MNLPTDFKLVSIATNARAINAKIGLKLYVFRQSGHLDFII